MCGFVGGTNPDWPYQRAVGRLQPRGPDSQATARVGDVTLAFARLAVIDPGQRSDQPMKSLDEQVWLVFNGEIYGFRSVRKQLEKEGFAFRTNSDTEVVLNAYLHWGDSFVERLDGMFALAIYDRRCEQLKLFRDRPGIKPLYYYWDGEDFAFSSELKAIEELCSQRLRVDNTAIYDFLTYRYVPTPKTLYENVKKLPAASRLIFELRKPHLQSVSRYWELPVLGAEHQNITVEDAASELRRLIDESVTEQLVADVDVGFFLSGGMDSSVVVAAAAKQTTPTTFSIGFDSAAASETNYARQIAEGFGTVHHEATFQAETMRELFPAIRDWYDEPFADTSAFPTFFLSQMARRDVTVAVSGEGGDEVFGGYRWYLNFDARARWETSNALEPGRWLERMSSAFRYGSLPSRAAWFLSLYASRDVFASYAKLFGGMTTDQKQRYARLLGIGRDYDDYWFFRQHWRRDLPLSTRLQYLDFHTFLPDDLLTKVDRVSMANSLEVRVPLVSQRLVEFSFSLPEHIRYHGRQLKGLLKHAYREVIPTSILQRSKKGFSVPRHYLQQFGRRPQEAVLNQLFGVNV